jgi:hypothetical protein
MTTTTNEIAGHGQHSHEGTSLIPEDLTIDQISDHASALSMMHSALDEARGALDAISASAEHIDVTETRVARLLRSIEHAALDLAWRTVESAAPGDTHPHGCADRARGLATAAVFLRSAASWLTTAAGAEEL